MDEGRKRVIGIIAGIMVARHLKTTEDLFDSRDGSKSDAMVAAAVQWAERILKKVDSVSGAGRGWTMTVHDTYYSCHMDLDMKLTFWQEPNFVKDFVQDAVAQDMTPELFLAYVYEDWEARYWIWRN
jgi:hypothetical protein